MMYCNSSKCNTNRFCHKRKEAEEEYFIHCPKLEQLTHSNYFGILVWSDPEMDMSCWHGNEGNADAWFCPPQYPYGFPGGSIQITGLSHCLGSVGLRYLLCIITKQIMITMDIGKHLLPQHDSKEVSLLC